MNNRVFYILLLILTCLISAVSQVFLKKAAQKDYSSFLRQYLNVQVVAAYIMFFLVIVGNTFVLKYIPLTVMNPIAETLPYILSIFFGYFFFNEKINIRKICGAVIIIIGIGVLMI